MLTGKFKRNEVPEAADSRAGYLLKLAKANKTHAHFNYWDELENDETFWNLTEVMERIAKAHSTYHILIIIIIIIIIPYLLCVRNITFSINHKSCAQILVFLR